MTGCIQPQEPKIEVQEKIVYKTIIIPEEYFVCEKVDVNSSKIKTQADVALLLTNLEENLDICFRNNLEAYKRYKNQVKK